MTKKEKEELVVIHKSFQEAIKKHFSNATYKSFFGDRMKSFGLDRGYFCYVTNNPVVHQGWKDFEKELDKLFEEIAGDSYKLMLAFR